MVDSYSMAQPMPHAIRVDVLVLQICSQFLDDPARTKIWAYDTAKRLDLKVRKVAFALDRLERAGWVQSEWERYDHVGWRPRRKLYKITQVGLKRTAESFARLNVRVG